MNDPKRLVDNPKVPAEAKSMLRSGAVPPMPAGVRDELATRVSGIAAGTAAATVFFSTKSVLAAMVVLGTGAAAYVAVDPSARPADEPVVTPSPAAERGVAPPPAVEALPELDPPPVEVSDDSVEPASDEPEAPNGFRADQPTSPTRGGARRTWEARREPSVPVDVAPVDDLARETAMLERARTLLEHDPGGALIEVGRHQAAYPEGQLVEERELIAVDALLRLGRRGQAQRRAEVLARRFPRGIHARRAMDLVSPL